MTVIEARLCNIIGSVNVCFFMRWWFLGKDNIGVGLLARQLGFLYINNVIAVLWGYIVIDLGQTNWSV